MTHDSCRTVIREAAPSGPAAVGLLSYGAAADASFVVSLSSPRGEPESTPSRARIILTPLGGLPTMMLRKALVTVALLSCVAMLAPTASAQITNIDDIQLYSDTGAPISPLNGLPVTVRGVITVLKGTYNSGTHYIQDPTGGINFFDSGAPTFVLGDSVEVSGTAGTFSGEINISGPFTYTVLGSGTVPPLVLTVSEAVDNDGSGTLNSADYEIVGMLVQVTGQVAFLPGVEAPPFPGGNAQGSFGLTDASGDTIPVFIDRTTGIDVTRIQSGDTFQITAPVSLFGGTIQLKPRMDSDLVENPGDPAPFITDIVANPWAPNTNESILISASITDNSVVASASLFYRDKGATLFTEVPMTDGGGGIYSATIPGTTAAGVEYYLSATDDSAQSSSVPGDAPIGFLSLAVGTTSIYDIQQNMLPGTDNSALLGEQVNIEGIITAAPGELQTNGLSNYTVAEPAGGPWGAVFIFEGTGANVLFRGDRVRIAGTVSEFSGITEVLPLSGAAVELVSFGNPLPPIPVLSTTELDTTEAWESMIVQTTHAAVADTVLGGAEWLLQGAGQDSSVYVDPAPAVSVIATLGEDQVVTGMLDTRFGRNEVVPRDDLDVFLSDVVANPGVPGRKGATFERIAPNPFNPSTKIEFNVPRKGKVELAIFNAQGRRVRTLVGGELDAGSHARVWDGTDDLGAGVGSGVYYARLRFELESVSVEKLTLVK